MAKVVGDIAIKVGADFSTMTTQLNAAQSRLDGFGKRVESQSDKIMKFQRNAGIAFAAISAGLATLGAAGKFALNLANEIENLSRVAGTSTDEFQALAFAAQGFGIEQEKLSDILKDVNDKVGDFLATGAGPMADFFDKIGPKVGVTADQFRGLSGPQALQLYISSLEKANVNQQEMTFYLEALASDATRLAPLFIGNANALGEFSEAARAAGVVIDEDLIRKSVNMSRTWDKLMAAMQSRFVSFAATVMQGLDAIFGLTEEAQIDINTKKLIGLTDELYQAEDRLAQLNERRGLDRNQSDRRQAGFDDLISQAEATRQAVFEELKIVEADSSRLQAAVARREAAKKALDQLSSGEGSGIDPDIGGGSKVDKLGSDLERLNASLMAEREAIIAEYEERRIIMDEALEAERIKDSEHKELMLRAQEDYAAKMAAIDQRERSAKLAALGGMFGDLSSLMNTNNKKLFKIGKAAAIAEATVSGYQAAVTAWEKGMKIGGPPVAAAFTAASLLKTGALIQSINSQQFGGGSSGAASAGGGAAGATTAAPPQQNVQTLNFSVQNDPFGISDRVIRQIVGSINEAQRNGSTLIRATVT